MNLSMEGAEEIVLETKPRRPRKPRKKKAQLIEEAYQRGLDENTSGIAAIVVGAFSGVFVTLLGVFVWHVLHH
jgi:hypothetical protein